MKQRKKLLEEAIKRSGGLVNSAGKPARSAVPLVNAAGLPLEGGSGPVHITEDIDAVLRSRGGQSAAKQTEKPGKPGKPTEKSETPEKSEKLGNQTEKLGKLGKPGMKSASEAMLNVYDAKEGDRIEVCPEACMLVQEIVMWLEETKGRRRGERG